MSATTLKINVPGLGCSLFIGGFLLMLGGSLGLYAARAWGWLP